MPTEGGGTVFARGLSHRGDACFSGEVLVRGEPPAIIAQFRQHFGGVDPAGPRKRHQDPAIGMAGNGLFDGAAEVLQLADQRLTDGDERAPTRLSASPQGALGAVRDRVAGEEGQRDRRSSVGEDLGGPGPENVEQCLELICQGDALC